MNFASLASRAAKFASANSPTILTAVGAVGAVATAYLAGKASFEASDVIRLKESIDEEQGVTLGTPQEIVKDRVLLVWKLYVPAISMGVVSVTCIIAANHVGSRRYAGLVAASTIGEKAYEEYKAKVIEKFGERKEEQVRDEIAQDRIERSNLEDVELIGVDRGSLCYDSFSARYFYSTVEDIRSAVNTVNNQINHDGNATLGDLYRVLDIPATEYSDLIGWNSDKLINPNISSALFGEKPIIVLDFRNHPGPDYDRFRRY